MLHIYGTFSKKRMPNAPFILSDESLQEPRTRIDDLARIAADGLLLPDNRDKDLVLVWEYDLEMFYVIVHDTVP